MLPFAGRWLNKPRGEAPSDGNGVGLWGNRRQLNSEVNAAVILIVRESRWCDFWRHLPFWVLLFSVFTVIIKKGPKHGLSLNL